MRAGTLRPSQETVIRLPMSSVTSRYSRLFSSAIAARTMYAGIVALRSVSSPGTSLNPISDDSGTVTPMTAR
jgi:hypothetical protein